MGALLKERFLTDKNIYKVIYKVACKDVDYVVVLPRIFHIRERVRIPNMYLKVLSNKDKPVHVYDINTLLHPSRLDILDEILKSKKILIGCALLKELKDLLKKEPKKKEEHLLNYLNGVNQVIVSGGNFNILNFTSNVDDDEYVEI